MAISTSSSVSASATYNGGKVSGTMTFTEEFIKFRPNQVTGKHPEVKIPYSKIFDAEVFKFIILSTSIKIIDTDKNVYVFNTMSAGGIMKFLHNKF